MKLNAIVKLSLALVMTFSFAEVPASETTNTSNLNELHLAVYKNKGCSCCDKWAKHLNQNDIGTTIEISSNLSQLKQELGINSRLASCHTAVIEQDEQQFVFEGHIPAKYIKQFLSNPPKGALGLSVPAMPVGSPGMEYQDKFMPYKVFLLHDNGQVSIFAEVNGLEEQF
ncbi:DUF411 domain-containing protein [Kangiella shandongensis]|uniref:DUF411 domain-containing protein n=1 Tax=Kangiella shandongensis TaxID=2763258 RepID=UPI001CC0C620|nr:DUF411 domain-containing protein [Kangiella shandongensis]